VVASIPGSHAFAAAVTDDLIDSPAQDEDSIDRLLETVVAIKLQQRCLEEQLNALLDQLQQLHESGLVDSSFHVNDTAFSWSPGRQLFSYPEPVLAIEQQLKLARKAAEGDGTATRRHGRSFWTIKLPGA
jgi:hypothetical protein